MLEKCWLASTSHYMVSFVVAGLSLLVIERSSTVLPKQTAIVRVPMSFKIKNDFILFLEYDDNIPLLIIISSLLLPLILCHTNINYLKTMFFGCGTVFSKTNPKSIFKKSENFESVKTACASVITQKFTFYQFEKAF